MTCCPPPTFHQVTPIFMSVFYVVFNGIFSVSRSHCVDDRMNWTASGSVGQFCSRNTWKAAGHTDASTVLVNTQIDAIFSMYLFISLLYMFRATQCSSSGESNCINTSSGIYRSVSVTAWYDGQEGVPSRPSYQAVIDTEWYIPDDVLTQFYSRDDEHWVARNM